MKHYAITRGLPVPNRPRHLRDLANTLRRHNGDPRTVFEAISTVHETGEYAGWIINLKSGERMTVRIERV